MNTKMTKKQREKWAEGRLAATDAWRRKTEALPGYAEAAEEVDCENSIANMLYEARRLANKTQEDVAREMGISQSSFSRMERGNVTIKNFMRCLDICGFNLVLTPK
jgi:DNA-binding XRE family transcriptional regulator